MKPFDIIQWLEDHPDVRWKARINCILSLILCASCIAGHLLNRPFLFAFGLELGMSALTAVSIGLVAVSILLLVRDPE